MSNAIRSIQERVAKPGATLIDLAGQRFGKRVVLRRAERGGKAVWWEVRCDCGRMDMVPGHSLKAGKSRQCRDCQAESRHVSGYGSTHDRLRRSRGTASNSACAHCGDGAEEWALKHDDSERIRGEFRGIVMDYSRNLDDYAPLCVECHRDYDLSRRRANASTAYRNSSTGVRGVYRKGNRFVTQVRVDGVTYRPGTFATLREAENAVRTARAALSATRAMGRDAR